MPNYRKYSHHFRAKRFRIFRDIVDNTISKKGQCRILDVGGTLEFWETFGSDLDWSKVTVKLLNLALSDVVHPGISSLAGDARSMPTFDNNSFDIVHSNSVIEHVGRWSDMVSMAEEIRRLAPAYFVQTPYFWFPMEPHARFLFLHWMPESWRYRLVLRFRCGFWEKQLNIDAAMKKIQSAVLLDKLQLQYLFPDAKIIPERFLGVTKSLIAIRQNECI
jgi:Methyltransferase domain